MSNWNNMKLLVCSVLFQSLLIGIKGEGIKATVMESVMDCMSKAPDDFNMETCQEMLLENNDNTQSKYESCKCIGACTAEKLGIMNAEGTGVRSKVDEFIESLESDVWKEEGRKLVEKCKDVPGKKCELSYNFMECVMKNSQIVRDLVQHMTGQDTKSDDSE